MGELGYVFFGDPFQGAFVAVLERAGKFGCREQVHELSLVHAVANEGDNPSVLGANQREARFFESLALDAVLGRFPFLELAANANPLVLVDIVLFLDAVEQQVLAVLFDVAEGCVEHSLVEFSI